MHVQTKAKDRRPYDHPLHYIPFPHRIDDKITELIASLEAYKYPFPLKNCLVHTYFCSQSCYSTLLLTKLKNHINSKELKVVSSLLVKYSYFNVFSICYFNYVQLLCNLEALKSALSGDSVSRELPAELTSSICINNNKNLPAITTIESALHIGRRIDHMLCGALLQLCCAMISMAVQKLDFKQGWWDATHMPTGV